MTTISDNQVIAASGGLVELGFNSCTTGISVDGTSWGSATIINPNTTVVCDGSPVVVEFSCGQVEISSASQVQFALFRDGSAIAYNLAWYTNNNSSSEYQPVSFFFRDTPTAGSHTYSVRAIKPPGTFVYLYASSGSSQSDGGPATMRVSKIVQATQWPAVTTGTIICTSSTRPASPFVGQSIYETDTKNELTWDGTAWSKPWNMPRGIVTTAFYASTNQGGITSSVVDLTSLTTNATYAAGRYHLVEYTVQGAYSTNYGDWARVILNIGGVGVQDTYLQLGNTEVTTVNNSFLTTSLAGSTTIKLQAVRTIGPGNVAFDHTRSGGSRLTVMDIGPA